MNYFYRTWQLTGLELKFAYLSSNPSSILMTDTTLGKLAHPLSIPGPLSLVLGWVFCFPLRCNGTHLPGFVKRAKEFEMSKVLSMHARPVSLLLLISMLLNRKQLKGADQITTCRHIPAWAASMCLCMKYRGTLHRLVRRCSDVHLQLIYIQLY